MPKTIDPTKMKTSEIMHHLDDQFDLEGQVYEFNERRQFSNKERSDAVENVRQALRDELDARIPIPAPAPKP